MDSISYGDMVTFALPRTRVRPYLRHLFGMVTSLNDFHATVLCEGVQYSVSLDRLTKLDAETVALLSGAGAIE